MEPTLSFSMPAKQVVQVLARFVSEPTARSVFTLAVRRAGGSPDTFGAQDLPRVLAYLRVGLGLFIGTPEKLQECLTALHAQPRNATVSLQAPVEVTLRTEDDVVDARREARTMAQQAGFSEAARTRFVTVVTELARNVVRHAGEGTIALSVAPAPSSDDLVLHLVAVDHGPGIADLERVLGRTRDEGAETAPGLRGVRAMASHFEVQTGPGKGTTVRVRMGGP